MPIAGKARKGFSSGVRILPVMNRDPGTPRRKKPRRLPPNPPRSSRNQHNPTNFTHTVSQVPVLP